MRLNLPKLTDYRKWQLYRELILEGKNPSEIDWTSEDEEDESPKFRVDTDSPWLDLFSLAKSHNLATMKSKIDTKTGEPFGDELLDTALSKSVKNIRAATGLSEHEVREEISRRFNQNRVAQGSAISAVRFFHGASTTWFTCGEDNEPGWDICIHCDTPKDS